MSVRGVGSGAEANPLVTLGELDCEKRDQSMNVIVSADLCVVKIK
jgi:hypothetical protein